MATTARLVATVALILGATAAGGTPAASAAATTVNDAVDPQLARGSDIKSASFAYSSSDFTVRIETYGVATAQDPVKLEVHLTNVNPPTVISGILRGPDSWGGVAYGAQAAVGSQPPDFDVMANYVGNKTYETCSSFGTLHPADPTPQRTLTLEGNWAQLGLDVLPSEITWFARSASYPGEDTLDTTSTTTSVFDQQTPLHTTITNPKYYLTSTVAGSVSGLINSDPETNSLNFPYGERVTMQYRAPGSSEFLTGGLGGLSGDGKVRTDPGLPTGCYGDPTNPDWEAQVTPRGNLWLRPFYLGNEHYVASYGPSQLVLVPKRVTLDLPYMTTIRRGQTVKLRGVVRPAGPGAQVRIEYRVGPSGRPWSVAAIRPLISGTDQYFTIGYLGCIKYRCYLNI